MTTRSKPLVAPSLVPTAIATAYTVPAGETALVKWVSAYNANAGAQLLTLWIDPGSGAVRQLVQVIPAASTVQVALWWPLKPGWLLRWTASLAGAVACGIYGAELEGVAD